MRTWTVILLCLLAAAAARPGHAQVSADYVFQRGTVTLSLFGGGVAFTDFRREVAWLGPDQPFEQRLSAQTSILGAGALTLWLGRRAALRVHASWTPSRFETRSTETYTMREEQDEEQAPTLSRLDIWMYDADLLFRLPLSLGRVEPYGVVGAGAVDYQLRTGEDEVVPVPAAAAFDGNHQRRFAGVLGLGALIPLERHRLLLNFELSSHIAKTPLSEGIMPLDAIDPEADARVDEVGYTSSVRLMLGLTIPLRVP